MVYVYDALSTADVVRVVYPGPYFDSLFYFS